MPDGSPPPGCSSAAGKRQTVSAKSPHDGRNKNRIRFLFCLFDSVHSRKLSLFDPNPDFTVHYPVNNKYKNALGSEVMTFKIV